MTHRSIVMPSHGESQGTTRRSLVVPKSVVGRLTVVLLLLIAAVAGVRPMLTPPAATNLSSLPGTFSAQRALQDLQVITVAPRVMGTPELDAARVYLAHEFEALGFKPEITKMTVLNESADLGAIVAAQSHDLIVRLPGSDSTGAILVAGHLDTVHTTTAASDCGGCAVSVLETARALVSGPALLNDIIFLIEDGEETTRAGSRSFVEQHPWAADVEVAINMEAMGTAGASIMYVTGPQSGWLVNESLKAMPFPVAYSFINDLVWVSGTGGSDLDQFLEAAPVGLGLVYVGNVPAYHTLADNVANLDLRTLQHQGDNVVELARHFGNLPLKGALTAPDITYFNLMGHVVMHYPNWVGVALWLIVVIAFLAIVLVGLRRKSLSLRGIVLGAALLVPALPLAMFISGAVWYGIRFFDSRLQVFMIGISYDREWYTLAFIAMTIGVVTAVYALAKRVPRLDLGVGALGWWVILAGVLSFLLPGSSPAFTLSSLLALIPITVVLFTGETFARRFYPLTLALAAAGIVYLITPILSFLGIFSGRAELLMGLPVIALFPAPFAAMVAALLIPLFGWLSGERRWLMPLVMMGVATSILLGVGMTANFSEERPKPNMVAYVQENNEAHWVTVGANVAEQRASLLDEWTTQFFPHGAEETTFNPFGAYYMDLAYPAYGAPAPFVDLPAPQFQVSSDRVDKDGLRHIALRITSQRAVPMLVLRLESEDAITEVNLLGETLHEITAVETPPRRLWIDIFGFSGEAIELALTIRGQGTLSIKVEERAYSLADLSTIEISPRPSWMIPSPTFLSDATIVRHTFVVPQYK